MGRARDSCPVKFSSMTLVDRIKAQVRTVMKSQHFHLLLIEGRAGVGKTTSIYGALEELEIEPTVLGAFTTPLGFFNYLHENSSKLILADDTAGLVASPLAMALLKSATWEQPGRGRVVRWTSTTDRSAADEFVFTGKIILAVNAFPEGPHADAVKNRSLDIKIEPSLEETREFLRAAASNSSRFPDQEIASLVLKGLLQNLNEDTFKTISYRNLQKAYEIAVHNPDSWETLAVESNPSLSLLSEPPFAVIKKLTASNLKVADQIREFERRTGFKRRSFFKYRKQLGL